jgi:hypothetical protein
MNRKPDHDIDEIVANRHWSGRGRWWVFAKHYTLFGMRGQVTHGYYKSLNRIAVFKNKETAVAAGKKLARLFGVKLRIGDKKR